MKALIIINPLLERKSGFNIPILIDKYLDRDKIVPTVLYSDYPGHAKYLAEQNAGKHEIIIAAGGDGTINEIAQGLIYSDAVLGILPIGSGNGLARSLGIPLRIIDSIKTINSLNITRIDSGMASGHRFFNMAGMGIAAEVAHAYAGSKRRGFFSYAWKLLRTLPGYSPVSLEATIGNRKIAGRYYDVSIANSTQWGYGAHISPHSKPDDGLLEFCLLRNFPKIILPLLLARLYLRSIDRSEYMETISSGKASIAGTGSCKGHVDGQPVEFTLPFDISLMPESLKVISFCPRK